MNAMKQHPELERLHDLLKATRQAKDNPQLKEDFLSSAVQYLLSRPEHWWCTPELREFVFELMILFSTASNEHIAKFKDTMNDQLETCTGCLEQYYKTKRPLYDSYVKIFTVDSVAPFLDALSKWDAQRVLTSLRRAQSELAPLAPTSDPTNPPPTSLDLRTSCALYEVLLQPALLLSRETDTLFVSVLLGVQRGHGFLRLANSLAPGVALLTVHADPDTRRWARRTVESHLAKGGTITLAVFDTLRGPFTIVVRALGSQRKGQRTVEGIAGAEGYNLASEALAYWGAFRSLVKGMTVQTVTERLLSPQWREDEQDMARIICRSVWDHLEDEGSFFIEAIMALNLLLEKAKGLFWSQMGVGTAEQAYDMMKRVTGNRTFEQRMMMEVAAGAGSDDGGGGEGGEAELEKRNQMLVLKLNPLFDCFNSIFRSFEDQTFELKATDYLLGFLLGYFQQDKWSDHCRVCCMDVAIKIILQCYKSENAMIPFESLNKYGEQFVRMAIALLPATTTPSPSWERVKTYAEDLVKFILDDDANTLRGRYVEFFNIGDATTLSHKTQLEICHRVWRTVGETPLKELGAELAGATLRAFGVMALVDMIPDELVNSGVAGGEDAQTTLMHYVNQSLLIIRQHLVTLLTQLSECGPDFFSELMRVEGVPQAMWKLCNAPDSEIRSATVMFLREAFNEITRVDMIHSFFAAFPDTALEGVVSTLADFVELTNEGCNTIGIIKDVFGGLLVLVGTDSDALLAYAVALPRESSLHLPPARLADLWRAFWAALARGMQAGIVWGKNQRSVPIVVLSILAILEAAQAVIASYRAFEQLIQDPGDNDDAEEVWSSQRFNPRLDYAPVAAALDPLSQWMFATKPAILQRLVLLMCELLKRMAHAGVAVDRDVYNVLEGVAMGTLDSKLTPKEKEDLFVALSRHEQLQPVHAVEDSDEEVGVGVVEPRGREGDFGSSMGARADPSGSSSKPPPMRQTKLTDALYFPKKLIDNSPKIIEGTSPYFGSSAAGQARRASLVGITNPGESFEEAKMGDNSGKVIVIEDDESDEFSDFLPDPDDLFNADRVAENSVQQKQGAAQGRRVAPTQSASAGIARAINASMSGNRTLPFGKASATSKAVAPTKNPAKNPIKHLANGSKLKTMRMQFIQEHKNMMEEVKKARTNSSARRTFVNRDKVAPATSVVPLRPRVNQVESAPEPPTDSESDDGGDTKSGLKALIEGSKDLPTALEKLRQGQERRNTRLISIPNLARVSQEEQKAQQMNRERTYRMRMSSNLEDLHKIILAWDITAYGDMPPNTYQNLYRRVPDRFNDAQEYIDVFQPLLLLEIWQQLIRSRNEVNETDVIENCIIDSRCHIDDFVDIAIRMELAYAKALVMEDLIFFADRFGPEFFKPSSATDNDQQWKGTGFLGKVSSIAFKRDAADISVRCCFPPARMYVLNSVLPKTKWRALKLSSLTTAHREYSALRAIPYYDLCKDILGPTPVYPPIIDEEAKYRCMTKYSVNKPQAEAILSAVEQKGFTLIQGPPGTGKTKTILGLIGLLLSKTPANLRPGQKPTDKASKSAGFGKLLVCAPSNAAIDEIVKRLMNGIVGENGPLMARIVRVGTSDAVDGSVKDVFLDTLVDKELANMRTTKENYDATSGGNKRERILEEIRKVKLDLNEVDKQIAQAENDQYAMGSLNDRRRSLLAQKRTLAMTLDEERDQTKTKLKELDILKRKIRERILTEADVMCCTLSGSGHEMLANIGVDFETVIIDEAAQSIEISSLIPLKYNCKRCVLVGDPNQLPPTVLSLVAAKFSYEQSLFVRLQNNAPNSVYLLSIQYRMHPEISAFPSKLFYESRLKDGQGMAEIAAAEWHAHQYFPPYCFFNIRQGREEMGAGKSLYNTKEAQAAVTLLDYFATQFPNVKLAYRVGIITPYKQQLRELKKTFEKRFGRAILEKVDFNTVDGFQGREKDIIIFSCVRAGSGQGIGFLSDIRRMNVGLTRAKSSLFILGHSASLLKDSYWGRLINDAQERGLYMDVDSPLFGHKMSGQPPQNLFLKPPPAPARSIVVTPHKSIHKFTTSSNEGFPKPAPMPQDYHGESSNNNSAANKVVGLASSADAATMGDTVSELDLNSTHMDESEEKPSSLTLPPPPPPSPPPPPPPKRKISVQEYRQLKRQESLATSNKDGGTSKVSSVVSMNNSSINEAVSSTPVMGEDDNSGRMAVPPRSSGEGLSSQKAKPNLFITKPKKRKASDDNSTAFDNVPIKERLKAEHQAVRRQIAEECRNSKRPHIGSKKTSTNNDDPFSDALNKIER